MDAFTLYEKIELLGYITIIAYVTPATGMALFELLGFGFLAYAKNAKKGV